MKFRSLLCCVALVFSFSAQCLADGMPEDAPVPVKKAPMVKPVEPPPMEPIAAPVEPAPMSEECCWNTRVSAGEGVWFFDEEDNTAFPGVYLDTWCSDYPVNFHVGIEGRHMDLHQSAAIPAAEFPGKTTEITLIKIPLSLEYMQEVAENLTLYLGAGPDIINTANDVSDTSVGFHLSSRLHYSLDEHWGVAVEGGYMWGEVDGPEDEIKLDHAYVLPTLSYTF